MEDTVPVAAPLAGRRVVTTRGASANDRLSTLLEAAGARVVVWPTCEYPGPLDPAPLEAALAGLDRSDWMVFTSARAVGAVGTAAGAAPSSPAGPAALPRVAVVGPTTARAATMAGWTVAVEGRGPGARGLAAQVAATFPLAGARVLFPAASGAAPTVEKEFTALGARVTRVEAYRTVVTPPPAAAVRADLAAGVDAVTFASPSAVEAIDRALGKAADDAPPGDANRSLAGKEACSASEARGRTPGRPGDPGPAGEMARALAGVVAVCIGPTTGAALARRGVEGVQVAATSTLEAMVDALVERFGGADADSRQTPSSSTAPFHTAGRPDAARGGATRSGARRRPGKEPDTSARPNARATSPPSAYREPARDLA